MYNFVLQILIMLSLAAMIYLVARKVPQIIDVVDETQSDRHSGFIAKIEKTLSALPLEKIDFVISQWLEKMLRKTRLLVMKLDNQMAHHLRKFQKKTAAIEDASKKLPLFEKEGEEIDTASSDSDISDESEGVENN